MLVTVIKSQISGENDDWYFISEQQNNFDKHCLLFHSFNLMFVEFIKGNDDYLFKPQLWSGAWNR